MKALRYPAVRVALAGLWIGVSSPLSAQEIEFLGLKAKVVGPVLLTPPRLQPEWGTQALGVRTIYGLAFQESDSSMAFSYNISATHRFRTGGGAFVWFDAALQDLPAGALITGLELEGCDTNASMSVLAALLTRGSPTGPTSVVGSVSTGNPDTPGCAFFGDSSNLIPVGHVVDNSNASHWVRVALQATDDTTSLGAVRVYYQLQVSPAPAVATFGDVPTTHPFFQFIEALNASGITAGCGSGNFCPDTPLTRGQMAVFLSKALGLHFPY